MTEAQTLNKLPSITKRGSCSQLLTKTGRRAAPLPQHHGASCKASQLLSAQGAVIKAGRGLGRKAALWLTCVLWERPAATAVAAPVELWGGSPGAQHCVCLVPVLTCRPVARGQPLPATLAACPALPCCQHQLSDVPGSARSRTRVTRHPGCHQPH